MKIIAKITLAIGILCLFAFAQTEKPKAAVYIKGNPEGRDALRMAVNTFLIKSQKYQMIAVDAIDVVAKEQNRQRDGSVSNEDIAQLGKDAGAQYVCVVERSESDGISYVSTSMVSVQSKIAELSEMSELPKGEKIITLIEKQIHSMLGINTPEPMPEPIAPAYSTEYVTEYTPEPTPTSPPSAQPTQRWSWETTQPSEEYEQTYPAQYESPHNPTKPVSLSSVYFSFYRPSVISVCDYKGQELKRNGLTAMLGFEGIDRNSLLGASFFIGGGALGADIKEFIIGFDVKKLFWIWKERIAVPISSAFDLRYHSTDISNRLVAIFIDEPKFSQESDDYLNGKRDMSMVSFEVAPSIDLQIFIGDNFSIYAGYMYRVTSSGDWDITYKIPEKDYSGKNGDYFKVPEEINPLKNQKEQIFGKPGTLRFGMKFH